MLSVIIICKNEAQSLAACLASVRFADEIIVLDSGSTDTTLEIAKKYTPHVYSTTEEEWAGYGKQKQRALAHAHGDWVLNVDADEIVSDALAQKIQSVIQSNGADAYRIPIRMCFYGKPLRFSSSPSRHIRLFKRKDAHYSEDVVHEKIVLPKGACIGRIKLPIMHHSFRDVSHALYKMNKYSSYSAGIRIQAHKKGYFGKAVLASLWMFFRCYILQRGILDGRAGLLLAMLNAQGTLYRGVKQIYRDGEGQMHLGKKDNVRY